MLNSLSKQQNFLEYYYYKYLH